MDDEAPSWNRGGVVEAVGDGAERRLGQSRAGLVSSRKRRSSRELFLGIVPADAPRAITRTVELVIHGSLRRRLLLRPARAATCLQTALAVMRVNASGVWNFGSAWPFGFTMARIGAASAGHCFSISRRPRSERSSTQRMPARNAFRPVRTASLSQPRAAFTVRPVDLAFGHFLRLEDLSRSHDAARCGRVESLRESRPAN